MSKWISKWESTSSVCCDDLHKARENVLVSRLHLIDDGDESGRIKEKEKEKLVVS
jgi:hypothetical protein